MSNSNTFSRDNKAAKSNKGVARPKDKIIGNSSTEDWLNDFDDDLSMMGYRDNSPYRERSSIDIHTPTGMIDMSQTGIPLMANGQYLPPYSGIHNMGTPYVREERMAKYGGWLDEYAPGGITNTPPIKYVDPNTTSGRYALDMYRDSALLADRSAQANAILKSFLKNNKYVASPSNPEYQKMDRLMLGDSKLLDRINGPSDKFPLYTNPVNIYDPQLKANINRDVYSFPNPKVKVLPLSEKPKEKTKPVKKKKTEVITPDYLSMLEANMPDMISQEPDITPAFIYPKKQSNVNNRISWRMDPETRKMVPVYLEGKQKVAQGKRIYNGNIPSSTSAIPEDFQPQFNRRDGGDLKEYQDAGQVSYLNAPIYKDFNDYYERNKDATTYVDKKITKLYPNKPWMGGVNPGGINEDAHLKYAYQQYNPELQCKGEQCTARANRPIAASFLGDGSSWFQNPDVTKKDLGAEYSVDRKPTEEEIKKYPYMAEDTEFGSLDAWDVVPTALKNTPKNVLFNGLTDPNEGYNRAISANDVWKKYDIPVGSYINLGDHGIKLDGKPMISGSHTVRVVGYAEDGEPMIADFGEIRKLTNNKFNYNRVAGVVTVPGKEKYTYKYFKDQQALEKKGNKDPYIADINSENYGEDYKKFHNNIVKEKNYIRAQLGVSPEKYDQYAKIALTLGGAETEFGKGFTYNIPLLDKLGESTGVAQVTESNVADKYKKTLAKYKDNPEAYNAMAALLYVKELDAYKDKWTKSGKKAGERPYVRSDEQSLKNIVRGAQGRNQQGYISSDLGRDVFRYTDANNKPKEITLPFKSPTQSDTDYENEVNALLKKTDPTLRFSAKGTKGERTIYKKTKGNTIPENLEDFVYYAWQAPNAVAYGDAQGDSGYYKKAKGIEAKLFGQKLAKKEMGGESGWLDDHDLPRAQDGFNNYTQPGPLATGDPRDSFGFTFPTPIKQPVIETKKPVKKQDVVKVKQQTFFPESGKNYNDILTSTPTYPSSKEQNTIISMSDERRAYEQNLANEKANREYNAIKGGLNVAGLFYYPASVAASALEFSEGNYGQGAAGLVPFVGPASKANAARNILNQASRNLLTKSYNAGIPYKIAAPIIKGAKKTTMYGANAVNAQDAYDAFTDLDEQRYGGVKKYKGLPKGTTKNLVRGINKLFLPDPKLFGPFGRKAFDPNSKFEDGGWLDDLPKAQMYNSQVGVGRFGDLRPTQDNTRVFVPNLPKKPLTKAEQQEAKQYAVKQASRDLEKANEKLAKFQRIKAANKAQAEQGFPTTRQEWADQTQAIGDKISLQNIPGVGQYIPDILDVTGDIGNMAASLGSAPLRAQQEDSYMPYLKAIGAPLFTGALAGIGTKTTGDFVNNLMNPFAGLNVKGLRRKPAPNAELDPNHYEFSNPEMIDYFNQQPKRDLAEARLYEKKAAEKENWLQQLEQDRQDALATYDPSDWDPTDLLDDNDDPFGAYRDAVGTQLPSNIPNTTEGIREQAMANFLQRDMPNIEPLRITPPSSVPPPPTYEQYLNNASSIGTTPLSREQYDYINNTPTPSLQSTPSQGWMGIQEPDWIRNAPGLFGTPYSGIGPRVTGQIDLNNIRNTARTSAPVGYSQADIDEARRQYWDHVENASPFDRLNLSQRDIDVLDKHGYGDAPDPWDVITKNLKQNKENADVVGDVKKQLDKDKRVTDRVHYNDVADASQKNLIDKSAIPSSENLNSLIEGFEKVISNTPPNHKLRTKLMTQLEDLKSTKWLREEYAKEVKERGGKPKENLSIVSSNPGSAYSLKHLVDEDGNILGSVDIDSKGYVGSSGVAHKYHGVNFDRLNLGSTDAAQTFLEQRLLKRNEEAFQNSVNRGMFSQNDFKNYLASGYFEKAAKKEAAEIMQRLQENNANKFGEALYRGVHHGIKDTKGGLKSHKHFVDTDLMNPITGEIETAKRGKLGWNAWTRQGKATQELDPNGFEQFRILRSLFPYIGVGALGASALQEKKYGGWLEDYE